MPPDREGAGWLWFRIRTFGFCWTLVFSGFGIEVVVRVKMFARPINRFGDQGKQIRENKHGPIQNPKMTNTGLFRVQGFQGSHVLELLGPGIREFRILVVIPRCTLTILVSIVSAKFPVCAVVCVAARCCHRLRSPRTSACLVRCSSKAMWGS